MTAHFQSLSGLDSQMQQQVFENYCNYRRQNCEKAINVTIPSILGEFSSSFLQDNFEDGEPCQDWVKEGFGFQEDSNAPPQLNPHDHNEVNVLKVHHQDEMNAFDKENIFDQDDNYDIQKCPEVNYALNIPEVVKDFGYWSPQAPSSPTESNFSEGQTSNEEDEGFEDNQDSFGDDSDDQNTDPDWNTLVLTAKKIKSTSKKPAQRRSRPSKARSPQKKTTTARILPTTRTSHIPKAKITNWLLKVLDSKEHNPSVMAWEDEEEGMFRIVDQNELANLWAVAKANSEMNYDKFSRGFRYYYSKKELRIVRKKLIYQFGTQSTWYYRKCQGEGIH